MSRNSLPTRLFALGVAGLVSIAGLSACSEDPQKKADRSLEKEQKEINKEEEKALKESDRSLEKEQKAADKSAEKAQKSFDRAVEDDDVVVTEETDLVETPTETPEQTPAN